MSHWSGSRPLASVTPLMLDPPEASSGCPLVAQCHGDPAALNRQDWLFHASQPFADDKDFGVGQFRALDLDLGGS